MGVPGFVSWLRNRCKDTIILTNLSDKCKRFYIDGNCLFHPNFFEVLNYCKTTDSIEKIESIIFKRICNFITFLIEYVNPEICYFVVDGVAPLAKINQQRKRRYKSVDENIIKNNLKTKYNKSLGVNMSNTIITPGTEFMERLHLYLLNYFHNRPKNIKYIYSSYHTTGEGEHKIFCDIKKQAQNNDTYVVYGLDADLFFLAMACQKENIYLLREENQFNNNKKHECQDIIEDVKEEMRYVSIDLTKQFYNEQITDIINKKTILGERRELSEARRRSRFDFIFLCYFLGNDFLPHFPSIDVHKSGLDILIDCYTDILIDYNINLTCIDNRNQISINNIFLFELLKRLGEKEHQYFTEILPEYNYHRQRRRCYATDEYAKELWMLENMMFHVDDPINLGNGAHQDYKLRYYEHYFNISSNYSDQIDLISHMYLEGLSWVTKYYYNECPSFMWQYPYTHAPFISDIYDYISRCNIDINNICFNKTTHIKPCVQLLCVLPPSHCHILPEKYAKLITNSHSEIIDMFPNKVQIDMINKDLFWMCIPRLPYLDIDRILEATKNISLSKEENIRNMEYDDFII